MVRATEYTETIDKKIGEKINAQRIYMGWSREQLARKIGVTHQQLSKYERGINRLTPARIMMAVKAFGKTVEWLFEDVKEDEEALPSHHQRMCIEVSRNFLRIKNPMHQNAINTLVRTLSED